MRDYQIDIKDNILVFRTTSFRTERGSFLHSAIFNRELASSLAAGAVIILSGFFFAFYFRITAIHFAVAIVAFAILFVIFRIYIFREPILETVFDKDKGIITVSLKKVIGGGMRSYRVNELSGVRLNHIMMRPENIDGIKVVEKIALQHGTVIPGFGEIKNFYNVELLFNGEGFPIFTTTVLPEAESVVDRLKRYIEFP